MNEIGLALIAMAVAGAVVAVLVLWAAFRKTQRDRREAHQFTRRERYASGLEGGRADTVLSEAAKSTHAQLSLIAVLTTMPNPPKNLADVPAYQALRPTLQARLKDRDPVRRGAAILLLALLGDPDAVAVATPALHDSDSDVRLLAARSLSILASPEAAAALLVGLRQRWLPDERVIERMAQPWATQTLIADLPSAEGNDPNFTSGVARALALIGDPAAEPALLHLVAVGTSEERINATRALGRCGTSAAVPTMIGLLSDDDQQVRVQAAAALGHLGDTAAVPHLERAMSDRGWWVRSNAASSLAELGPEGRAALQRVSRSNDRFAAQRADEQLLLLGSA